ncbi:hypothetical protein GCM10010256_80420 [Streptomyces coeruleorubidus]|nr:hypothetical protein GCM10010256_80420 [Streptomyces coeruleorubidus]
MDAPLHAEPLDVPAELALVAIDMEKYSQIPEARMAAARCDVDDVVATVLAECQLPDPQELPGGYKDSGDGGDPAVPALGTGPAHGPAAGPTECGVGALRGAASGQ